MLANATASNSGFAKSSSEQPFRLLAFRLCGKQINLDKLKEDSTKRINVGCEFGPSRGFGETRQSWPANKPSLGILL
jgi:hypothetical protein